MNDLKENENKTNLSINLLVHQRQRIPQLITMPIKETIEFESDDFRREAAGYSTARLKQLESAASRKSLVGSVAVGAGHVFAESVTNTEAMGSGLSDGVNKSTGLTTDLGTAVSGAGGQIEQLAEHLGGGNAADVADRVAVADATAYHAGMVQAQILEEHVGNEGTEALLIAALASLPEKPGPACARAGGTRGLACDACGKSVKEEKSYWHCCICKGDNYDICSKCRAKGVVCKNKSHTLKKYVCKKGDK
ncbi:hypothetical protein M426DRAFT_258981 [Hypoxylon sp. CI-4A]|nr:hypothetical protein M426DRAFT_258981 [Hypoxylon sp. CI-4A]